MKKMIGLIAMATMATWTYAIAEEAPAAQPAATEAAAPAEKAAAEAPAATEAATPAAATEAKKVKIKTFKPKIKGDVVKVTVIIPHPMLTYNLAKKQGVPVNFIQHITATVNGKVVYDVSTSQFLSKNPLFKFKFKKGDVKKGDEMKLTYTDHTGTYYATKKIK